MYNSLVLFVFSVIQCDLGSFCSFAFCWNMLFFSLLPRHLASLVATVII